MRAAWEICSRSPPPGKIVQSKPALLVPMPAYDVTVLTLAAVTKRFGERIVLIALSLEVAAGEYVAIVGDSGIGKSTLLNVMVGLEPVDGGKIRFLHEEIT